MNQNESIVLTESELKKIGLYPICPKREVDVSFSKEMEKALVKMFRKQIKNRRKWG